LRQQRAQSQQSFSATLVVPRAHLSRTGNWRQQLPQPKTVECRADPQELDREATHYVHAACGGERSDGAPSPDARCVIHMLKRPGGQHALVPAAGRFLQLARRKPKQRPVLHPRLKPKQPKGQPALGASRRSCANSNCASSGVPRRLDRA
jgi:hypothetical protein